MKIKYKKEGRLLTRCPVGRECMVASQMCQDCDGFQGRNIIKQTIICKNVTVRNLTDR